MAVGSTPVLSGGGLSSSTVGLCSTCCSGVSSTRDTGFTSACCSGTPIACSARIFVACYSGTSSLPLGGSSTRVLREAICTLGGGGLYLCRHQTTRSPWPSANEWSGRHLVIYRLVCGERQSPFSSSSGPARLPLPVSPRISPIMRGDVPCDQHLNL